MFGSNGVAFTAPDASATLLTSAWRTSQAYSRSILATSYGLIRHDPRFDIVLRLFRCHVILYELVAGAGVEPAGARE